MEDLASNLVSLAECDSAPEEVIVSEQITISISKTVGSLSVMFAGEEFKTINYESENADNVLESTLEVLTKQKWNLRGDIGDWEYCKNRSELRKWNSPNGKITVTLQEDRNGSFRLRVDGHKNGVSSDSYNFIRAKTYLFLVGNDPLELEVEDAKRTAVMENLQELPGIGKTTARRLMRAGVESYEEVKKHTRFVKSDYEDDLLETIDNMDGWLLEHPETDPYTEHLVIDEI